MRAGSLIGDLQPKKKPAGGRRTSLIGGPSILGTFPTIFHLSNSFGTVPSPAILSPPPPAIFSVCRKIVARSRLQMGGLKASEMYEAGRLPVPLNDLLGSGGT